MRQFYYYVGADRRGPVNAEQLRAFVAAGAITPETIIECDGKRIVAGKINGLFPSTTQIPVPPVTEEPFVPAEAPFRVQDEPMPQRAASQPPQYENKREDFLPKRKKNKLLDTCARLEKYGKSFEYLAYFFLIIGILAGIGFGYYRFSSPESEGFVDVVLGGIAGLFYGTAAAIPFFIIRLLFVYLAALGEAVNDIRNK